MHKIVNGKVAVPLDDYARPSNTRTRRVNIQKFQVYSAKTQIFKHSFFPRTIPEWNATPDDDIVSIMAREEISAVLQRD